MGGENNTRSNSSESDGGGGTFAVWNSRVEVRFKAARSAVPPPPPPHRYCSALLAAKPIFIYAYSLNFSLAKGKFIAAVNCDGSPDFDNETGLFYWIVLFFLGYTWNSSLPDRSPKWNRILLKHFLLS